MVSTLSQLFRPTTGVCLALLLVLVSAPLTSEAQRRASLTVYQREAQSLVSVANTICASRFLTARSSVKSAVTKFKNQFNALQSNLGGLTTSLGATVTSLAGLPNDVSAAVNAFNTCAGGTQSLATLKQFPTALDQLAQYAQMMKSNAGDLFGAPYEEMIDRVANSVAGSFRMAPAQLGQCLKTHLGLANLRTAATAAQAEVQQQMAQLSGITQSMEGSLSGAFNSCMAGLDDLGGASIQFSAQAPQAAWQGFQSCFMAGAGGSITGYIFSDLELTADAFSLLTPGSILSGIGQCVASAGESIYKQVNPVGTIRKLADLLKSLVTDFGTRIQSALTSLEALFNPANYDWSRKDADLRRACAAFKRLL